MRNAVDKAGCGCDRGRARAQGKFDQPAGGGVIAPSSGAIEGDGNPGIGIRTSSKAASCTSRMSADENLRAGRRMGAVFGGCLESVAQDGRRGALREEEHSRNDCHPHRRSCPIGPSLMLHRVRFPSLDYESPANASGSCDAKRVRRTVDSSTEHGPRAIDRANQARARTALVEGRWRVPWDGARAETVPGVARAGPAVPIRTRGPLIHMTHA